MNEWMNEALGLETRFDQYILSSSFQKRKSTSVCSFKKNPKTLSSTDDGFNDAVFVVTSFCKTKV